MLNRSLYMLALILAVFSARSQNPSLQWVKGMGNGSLDMGFSIAIDVAGNVYTTGRFRDTADFDPGVGTYTLVSAGSDDIYICKVDNSGNFLWAKRIGGANPEVSLRLVLDGSGNIYISGAFWGLCDFDPGPGVMNLTSTGNYGYDAFVAKFNASGNLVWAKGVGSVSFDFAQSLCVNQAGEVYVTGDFTNTIDLDPGPGTLTVTTNGIQDIFLLKLDAAGNLLWGTTLGSTGTDGGTALKCDAAGNLYVSGYFTGTVDFDPGPGTATAVSAGWQDVFILKLDAAGNFNWLKTYGGSGVDNCINMSMDPSGNLYSTGYFSNTADFDPGPATANLVSAGLQDLYILKLDPLGNFIWAKSAGSGGNDLGRSVSLDGLNNVYITGSFSGIVDFDPGIGSYSLTAGASDGFITKLDPFGNFLWAAKTGGPLDDAGYSIAVDGSDNVFVTGYFQDTCDFDPGAGTYHLTSLQESSFVLKLVQCNGTPPSVNATSSRPVMCEGESAILTASGAGSYWWDNGAMTSVHVVSPAFTTNYIVTGLDANGCSDTAIVIQMVDACLGTNGPGRLEKEIHLFPNPTKGVITLQTESSASDMLSLELTTSLGERLLAKNYRSVSPEGLKINLEEWSAGLYLLKVKTGNGTRTFKLVKE